MENEVTIEKVEMIRALNQLLTSKVHSEDEHGEITFKSVWAEEELKKIKDKILKLI